MLDKNSQSLKKFIKITKLLSGLVSVPKIFINESDEGILILENFHNTKFSDILSPSNKKNLYQFAIDALVHIHDKIPPMLKLPQYSK